MEAQKHTIIGGQTSAVTHRIERLVTRLKNSDIEVYREMCRSHLKALLGVSGVQQLPELFDVKSKQEANTQSIAFATRARNGLSRGSTLTRAKRVGSVDSGGLFGQKLSGHIVDRLNPLISFLGSTKCLNQEGLFRKTGSVSRQRLLHDKLNLDADMERDIEGGQFSAHDCASVLKTFLGEMPEPLLLTKHFKAHCLIAGMNSEAQRIQLVQFLLQLLPEENLRLLRSLLDMLNCVTKQPGNRMTAESLGTVLAPRILLPKQISMREVKLHASIASSAIGFLIEKNSVVFQYPEVLVQDIINYWQRVDLYNKCPASGSSAAVKLFKHGAVTSTPKSSFHVDGQSTGRRSVGNTLKKLLTRARRNFQKGANDSQIENDTEAENLENRAELTVPKKSVKFARFDNEEELQALIGRHSCFVPSPIAFSLSPVTDTEVREPLKRPRAQLCSDAQQMKAVADNQPIINHQKYLGRRKLASVNSLPDPVLLHAQPLGTGETRKSRLRRSAIVKSNVAPTKFRRGILRSSEFVMARETVVLKSVTPRQISGLKVRDGYISDSVQV